MAMQEKEKFKVKYDYTKDEGMNAKTIMFIFTFLSILNFYTRNYICI